VLYIQGLPRRTFYLSLEKAVTFRKLTKKTKKKQKKSENAELLERKRRSSGTDYNKLC